MKLVDLEIEGLYEAKYDYGRVGCVKILEKGIENIRPGKFDGVRVVTIHPLYSPVLGDTVPGVEGVIPAQDVLRPWTPEMEALAQHDQRERERGERMAKALADFGFDFDVAHHEGDARITYTHGGVSRVTLTFDAVEKLLERVGATA